MEYRDLVDSIAQQAVALRAAAVAAGPDTQVPTCPEWTVRQLVEHLAGVHTFAVDALRTDPDGPPPNSPEVPEFDDFAKALGWWDTTVARLLDELRDVGPDAPAWSTTPSPSSNCWARRQAHEVAVHRLDVELAAGTAEPVVFDPEFATSGIEEFVDWVMFGTRSAYDGDLNGTVQLHATDVGRTWLITIEPGRPFDVTEEKRDTDASIVGTADAVYRALWRRPGDAVISGDQHLVDLLAGP